MVLNLETPFCFTFHNHNWPIYFMSFKCFSPLSLPLINHPHILPVLQQPSTWSLYFHFSIPIHFLPLKWSFKTMLDYITPYFRSLLWAQSVSDLAPCLSVHVCWTSPFTLAAWCLKVLQLRGVPPHMGSSLQSTSSDLGPVPPGASSDSSKLGQIPSIMPALLHQIFSLDIYQTYTLRSLFFQCLLNFSPLCLRISRIVLGASGKNVNSKGGHHYLIRHT